jgi:hypothetical protein
MKRCPNCHKPILRVQLGRTFVHLERVKPGRGDYTLACDTDLEMVAKPVLRGSYINHEMGCAGR